MRIGLNALLAALIPTFACADAQAETEQSGLVDGSTYTAAVRLGEVEPGRRLNLYCVGDGAPVVVFEGGLTEPINTWGLVQPQVGAETTACSYDRAGVGFSDEGSRPATAQNMVDDLHKLLTAANLRPPYVIVGASSGGLNARLFAYTYPDEVVGLVLVDPSHEDQTEGFRKLDPRGLSPEEWDAQVIEPSIALRRECIAAIEASIDTDAEMYKKCSFSRYPQLSPEVQEATARFQMTPKFQRAQLSEEEHVFRTTVRQLKAATRSLGTKPVVVLAQDGPPPPTEPLSQERMALRVARYNLWLSLSQASASVSERGEVRVVPGAGHNIALERPDAVISAVHDVIRASKDGPRR